MDTLVQAYDHPAAKEALIAALQHPLWSVRFDVATRFVGHTATDRSVAVLTEGFDRSAKDLHTAMATLRKVTDVSAKECLRLALTHDRPTVRSQAAMALGWVENHDAALPLISKLRDGEGSVRSSAAWALGELGPTTDIRGLIEALGDQDPEVRVNAIHSLGKIGNDAAIPHVQSLLDDTATGFVLDETQSQLKTFHRTAEEGSSIRTAVVGPRQIRDVAAEALKRLGSPVSSPGTSQE